MLPKPGLWLSGLQLLVVTVGTAAASLATLAAARQLLWLQLCESPAAQQEQVLSWAAQHPSLRELQLDAAGPHQSIVTFVAVTA